VHLTNISAGKTTKIDLCAMCAEEHGVNDPTGFALLKLIEIVEAKRNGVS